MKSVDKYKVYYQPLLTIVFIKNDYSTYDRVLELEIILFPNFCLFSMFYHEYILHICRSKILLKNITKLKDFLFTSHLKTIQ